jgi:hypothetical protein
MTPKEKAKELVLKFEAYTDSADERGFAKECALFTVDEILEITASRYYNLQTSELIEVKYMEYWQEVKQEIEKM